ncbi:MAG: sigma-70 family RNA polymerase sigma factor [Proteobacteria bacterium]|nr:sigma-70 family RNA polymerase sigma factor [Pseudomonadota bacterium]
MRSGAAPASGGGVFPDTSWGLILATRDPDGARSALAALCRRYWTPIYVCVRRQGYAPTDAEDLTQAFFLHLIEHETVARAERVRGHFRSFLLGALRFFLAHESEREQARKRGGGLAFAVVDVADVESQLAASADARLSMDLQFDREWARTVVAHARTRLREEYARSGQDRLYDALQCCLDPGASAPSYVELGKDLGRNEGAVKVAVHRLRNRFREVLRREVGYTVVTMDQVGEELRHLRDVLALESTA